MENIKEKVVAIIRETKPDIDVDDGTCFVDDAIFDSFDIVMLVSALDKGFGISIDGAKIAPEYFNTVDDIVRLVSESPKKRQ